MSLKHLHVVHVRLPVLDEAGIVTGHHPTVVVGPHHRPNRAVVSLPRKERQRINCDCTCALDSCLVTCTMATEDENIPSELVGNLDIEG
jgi:hypothetical protein